MTWGHKQISEVDFTEDYSPVVSDVTLNSILPILLINNFYYHVKYVDMALLYATLKEEIYLRIPQGMEEALK